MKRNLIRSLTTCAVFAGAFYLAAPAAEAQAPKSSKPAAGKPSSASNYWDKVSKHYKKGRKSVAAVNLVTKTPMSSRLVTVGDQPDGFGKGFVWDRKDDEVMLVLFINPADHLGVSISGVKDGDEVWVTSAAGIGSFTDDKGNRLASSLVGVVAAGAKLAQPELSPLITAGEEFAKEAFNARGAKHKRRDAFGVDPGSGHKARQEGGVLVTMPADGGPVYSGGFWDRDRWVKEHADRSDDMRPGHFKYGFFLQREPHKNVRRVSGDGELYVLAWDHKFEDNAGFYKVFVHLKKGPPNDGPILLKKGLPAGRPTLKRK